MEYRVGEGKLVTYERCTAASNIAAGTPLGILTASDTIYTLGKDPVGFTCTGTLGYHFIGIAAEDYSAGACPITVFTEGVFRLRADSGAATADCYPGWPVWADSGMVVTVGTGNTSDACIGTLVSRPAEISGAWIDVRINPAIYRWCKWVGTQPGVAYATATQAAAMGFPVFTGHA
jgi:hypothetical protein